MPCAVVGKVNILIIPILFCAGPPLSKSGTCFLLQGARVCGSPLPPSQLARVTAGGSLSPEKLGAVHFSIYPQGGEEHTSKRKQH